MRLFRFPSNSVEHKKAKCKDGFSFQQHSGGVIRSKRVYVHPTVPPECRIQSWFLVFGGGEEEKQELEQITDPRQEVAGSRQTSADLLLPANRPNQQPSLRVLHQQTSPWLANNVPISHYGSGPKSFGFSKSAGHFSKVRQTLPRTRAGSFRKRHL